MIPAPSPVSGSQPQAPPMREIDEDLQALVDDGVALLAAQARDEPHAAGVMLVARIVEALGRG